MLLLISVAIAACGGVSHYLHDTAATQRGLFLSAGIVFLVGLILALVTRGKTELSRKDGFGIVTFGWLAAALFGSLPYLLCGTITDFPSALFETMSGFTTTGASILTDLEAIPRGVMFWRCLTQWFGGMGVLVLCVAILPFLGVGGMQIYRAEMPGPSKDRLTPRIAQTAELLWGVYLALTVIETLLLKVGGMSWYDALCHSFCTVSTGGYSTRTASVAAFNSLYIESIITIFMFLSGINFALHFRAMRGEVTSYFKDPEFRFYLAITFISITFLTFEIWRTVHDNVGTALRAASFQAVSIITTTGFGTDDFNQWPNVARLSMVLLMFLGACAGSTSGGIKSIRIFVLFKLIVREIRLFMMPNAVLRVKLGKKSLPEETASNIAAFVLIFMLTFAICSLLMAFFTPDIETATSSVIATLGNIGPGIAHVGPTSNFAGIPAPGKLILTFCMLLGRLELYTVLILFLPRFWEKVILDFFSQYLIVLDLVHITTHSEGVHFARTIDHR